MRHSNLAVCWTKALVPSAITTFFTALTPPQAVHNSNTITLEFASNYSDSRFVCALNDDDPTFCSSPKTFINLRDGDYRFHVFAQSPSGGTDPVGVTHQWRVDTLPPSTWLAVNPTGPNSLEFTLFANEPNSTFLCSIDSGPAHPCTSPHTVAGLALGPHTFKTFAVDEAGNVDPWGAAYSFEFAAEAPIHTRITAFAPTALYTAVTNKLIVFTASQPQAAFLCSLNGSPFAGCTTPWEASSLPDGDYSFHVRAVNPHGVVDPIGDHHSFTVDTVAAVGSNVSPQASSTSVTVTWTTNEPATTRLFWGLNGNVNREVGDDGVFKTQHTVRLTGLSSNTVYTLEPAGQDRAANPHKTSRLNVRTLR